MVKMTMRGTEIQAMLCTGSFYLLNPDKLDLPRLSECDEARALAVRTILLEVRRTISTGGAKDRRTAWWAMIEGSTEVELAREDIELYIRLMGVCLERAPYSLAPFMPGATIEGARALLVRLIEAAANERARGLPS